MHQQLFIEERNWQEIKKNVLTSGNSCIVWVHKVQTEVEGLALAPQQSLPPPFSKDNLKFHKDGSNQDKATGHDSSKTIEK